MLKRLTGFTAVTVLCAAMIGAPSPAGAASGGRYDSLLAGSLQCSRYFPRHERLNSIPVHLLSAIAVTESGRYSQAAGYRVPWPWTINADGKGYYFSTQKDAVQAAAYLIRKGANNVDVGCMQVSLMAHPKAFRSLYQAFDPRYNVAYAARFLREKFDESGSWNTAIAYYHSKTPGKGRSYAYNVLNAWRDEINKVSGRQVSRRAVPASPDALAQLAPAAGGDTKLAAITSSEPEKRVPQMKVYSIDDFHKEAAEEAAAMSAPKPAQPSKEKENGVTIVRLKDESASAEPAPRKEAPKEQQFAEGDDTTQQYAKMIFSY